MHTGAVRTDSERLARARQDQVLLDTSPTKPPHQIWDLRRRNKSSEIGRQFRFDANLQIQRVMDGLQSNVSRYVPSSEYRASDRALKKFVKTGEYNFSLATPDFIEEDLQ